MNKIGHWGMGLLFAAPVAIAIATTQNSLDTALPFVVIAVASSRVPDVDQHAPLISHRGITHTLAFVFAFTAVVGAATAYTLQLRPAVELPYPRKTIWLYVTGGVGTGLLSHLAADLLTKSYHHGLKLFWPISSRVYHLSVSSASSKTTNTALLLLGLAPYLPLYFTYV